MIDQVIWLLANTAGESTKLRNMVLSETFIVDALTRFISEAQMAKVQLRIGLLANIIWCVCNLSRQKSSDGIMSASLTPEEQSKFLFIIRAYIDTEQMGQNMKDALWALSYLLENAEDSFITQVC